MPPITVIDDSDWLRIADLNAPIMDPLVLRAGEVFLRGAGAFPADQRQATWEFLRLNFHALFTFFDRLILHERIPVFDYQGTFDVDVPLDLSIFDRVNVRDEVLLPVTVGIDAYGRAKNAAMARLEALYGRRPQVPSDTAHRILGELSNVGYEWRPSLGPLEHLQHEERRLAQYILGALIFGEYASLSGADHVLQPKRSRLMVELALDRVGGGRQAEVALFAELKQHQRADEVPYTPTFLPTLLTGAAGPRDVLRAALSLRETGGVRDYRQWLLPVLTEFHQVGRIDPEASRTVAAIQRELEGGRGANVPEVGSVITAAVSGDWGGVAGAAASSALDWLFGRALDNVPGRRHIKLLSRAIIEDRAYVDIERAIERVWTGPAIG